VGESVCNPKHDGAWECGIFVSLIWSFLISGGGGCSLMNQTFEEIFSRLDT